MRIDYTKPPEWPATGPGRFIENLRGDPQGCSLALLGIPNDIGVELNAGRVGACDGPTALRMALSKASRYDGRAGRLLDVPIFDAGDVVVSDERNERGLFETHRRIEAVMTELYGLGMNVVCVGGGHDSSLPALCALATHTDGLGMDSSGVGENDGVGARNGNETGRHVDIGNDDEGSVRGALLGGINVDAHLDVRQRIGSGMPFRALIERQHLEPARFVEYGLGRFSNDEQDLKWAHERGIRCIFVEDVAAAPAPTELLGSVLERGVGFVSVDLDGIDQAFAPGVSAPNAMGLGVLEAAALAEAAGRDRRVRQFDLMELCPRHDEGGRTARVAARLLLAFVAGFAQRGEPS